MTVSRVKKSDGCPAGQTPNRVWTLTTGKASAACFRRHLPLVALLVLGTIAAAQDHPTLGPGGCGLGQNNCHASEGGWWRQDPHRATVDKLYDALAMAEDYASRMGMAKGALFKGDQGCMRCHGTPVTGQETKETDDGVSCESCHGPGADYKEPHTEGDKSLGRNRPGYLQALKLGLKKLEDTAVRAENCVGCHYITEQKLLAAGHSDGRRFNYVSGIRKISAHWKRPVNEKADLNAEPFENEKRARPMPVAVVRPQSQTAPAQPPQTAQNSAPVQPRIETRIVYVPQAGKGDSAFPLTAGKAVELPPFPEINPEADVAEILAILKKRLELLYEKIEP